MRFQSTMLELGTPLPVFALPDSAGTMHSPAQFATSPFLLVAFICNHCPYVLHILDEFVRYTDEYRPRGLAAVAISSNDVLAHPEDGPKEMGELAKLKAFGFPYLYDESQAVALQFSAACTPDFYLFDAKRRLQYRGQFDSSRPRTPRDGDRPMAVTPVTGTDLRQASEALLRGEQPAAQRPSMGCSIKWKPGKDPDGGMLIPPA
jgi:peroxiredoxin